ncbi:hypothetical protein CDV31_016654 [Fusarium ambrosium]|uniref:Uncharacterized protein n=1 Tax=Fusarium ambrosium TaxID=131363 RepID=A0A428S4W0_9HYPO|nr:hypothetical protein CDV31_016654 [Fusarium ambrosium]
MSGHDWWDNEKKSRCKSRVKGRIRPPNYKRSNHVTFVWWFFGSAPLFPPRPSSKSLSFLKALASLQGSAYGPDAVAPGVAQSLAQFHEWNGMRPLRYSRNPGSHAYTYVPYILMVPPTFTESGLLRVLIGLAPLQSPFT